MSAISSRPSWIRYTLGVLVVLGVVVGIRLLTQPPRELVHDVGLPDFAVMHIDWNPRGETIAARLQGGYSPDRAILVDTMTWNVSVLVSASKGEYLLGDLKWNPEGRLLAVELPSRRVGIFDIPANRKLTELDNHIKGTSSTIRWLSSTSLVLLGGGSAELIDVLTPESVTRLDHIEGMNTYVDQLCWLSMSSQQLIGLVEYSSHDLHPDDLQGVCSPDSRYFASNNPQNDSLSILDMHLNQWVWSSSDSVDLYHLAWSPTSANLILIRSMRIWAATDSKFSQLPVPEGTSAFGHFPDTAAWSPDGSKFAILGTITGSFDTYPLDRILVWDVLENRLIQTIFQDDIICISWSPTSDALAVGSRGHIKVWSITE